MAATSTFMTIQDVPPEKWLAQVTMIDAAVGDSNVIDLIAHNDPTIWSSRVYRRVVIDTGISYHNQKKSKITAAIMDVLKRRTLPVNVDNTGAYKSPVIGIPLAIDEVQITHADIDHIGNAPELMEELFTAKMLNETKLRYSYVPPASPTLTLSLSGAIPHPTDKASFIMAWKVGGLFQWLTDVDALGLDAIYEYRHSGWDGTLTSEIVKDPANNNDYFIKFTALNTDLNKVISSGASFGVELQLAVAEMSGEMDGIGVYGELYTFEWKPTQVFIWVEHLLQPASIPKPKSAIPSQTKTPSFKTTHEALAKLNPYRFKDPKIVEWIQPLDDQPDRRIRDATAAAAATPTMDVIQIVISPTAQTYKALARYEVMEFLNKKIDPNDPDEPDEFDETHRIYQADASIANKASVVTLFRREEAGFDMLFTGDAHDQESDIRDTLTRYKHNFPETFNFSVLKVPHHGSNTTTHSMFYERVRAKVYLICGQHRVHGNPRYSSLRAIIEGFRGNPRPGKQPYRLYFSDPDSMLDFQQSGGKWMRSPVRKILETPALKSGTDADDEIWYEMYRLNRPAVNTRVGYGSILFWLDENGNIMDSHHPDEWTLCTV